MPAALAVAWTRAAAAAAAATGCRHRSGDVRRWRRTARPPMARAGAIGCLTGFRLSKGEPVGCGRPVQRVGRAGARGRCGRRRSASAGAMRSKSGLSRRRCGTSLHPPCTLPAPSLHPPHNLPAVASTHTVLAHCTPPCILAAGATSCGRGGREAGGRLLRRNRTRRRRRRRRSERQARWRPPRAARRRWPREPRSGRCLRGRWAASGAADRARGGGGDDGGGGAVGLAPPRDAAPAAA